MLFKTKKFLIKKIIISGDIIQPVVFPKKNIAGRHHIFSLLSSIVSVDGIGPSTSVLSGQRSTTELHAQTLSKNQ